MRFAVEDAQLAAFTRDFATLSMACLTQAPESKHQARNSCPTFCMDPSPPLNVEVLAGELALSVALSRYGRGGTP